MPSGHKHELNDLDDPDFDPLDPACVSNPACWLPQPVAADLQKTFIERARMIKHAPKFRDEGGKCGVWYADDEETQEDNKKGQQ